MKTTLPAPIRPLAVAAVLCLLGTACDAPASGPTTADAGGTARGSVDDAPAADSSAADASEPAMSSPLSDFLNAGEGFDQGEFERQQREYNQTVVACMAAQGFEYTPDPEDDDGDDVGPWDLPPDQFVASYGYGLTTIEHDAAPTDKDPNRERIDAMSTAERTAYYRALLGELMPLDEDGYPDSRPVEVEPGASGEDPDMGCSGEAGEQVWGDQEDGAEADFARFEGLIDDMLAIRERIDQDPRVVEAIQTWRDCMADAGHPFDAPDDPRNEIHDRMAELQGDGSGVGDESGLEQDVPLRSSLEDVDPEALEQLRAYELDLAAVDRRCTVEHEVEQIRTEVQVELEQAFMEEHRDELEAYRDQIAAGGGGMG